MSVRFDMAGGLAVVVGILGLIALIAAAAAVARSTYVKAQLEALRDDRDDQAHRIDRQDDEIEQLRRENAELRAKCAVLEKVVTGREQLERIEVAVNDIKARVLS